MTSDVSTQSVHFSPLTSENLPAVYSFVQNNEFFYQMPMDFFRRGTFGDEGFESDWSIVATKNDSPTPIGMVLAINRNNTPIIKVCLVAIEHRYKGTGSKMLVELLARIKKKIPKHTVVRFGDSPPRYWTPGVDLRHTSLIFFLEKHGFKRKGQRQNLTVDLTRFQNIPKAEKNGYIFDRVKPEEKQKLIDFVGQEHKGSWPIEASLGLENTPPTTFVAKDQSGKFVGFAACSVQFPGSFGPTAVNKSLRGGGIGGELLRWCCFSQKQEGLKEMTIQWVGPVKYYSKSASAFLSHQFYVMVRKL